MTPGQDAKYLYTAVESSLLGLLSWPANREVKPWELRNPNKALGTQITGSIGVTGPKCP